MFARSKFSSMLLEWYWHGFQKNSKTTRNKWLVLFTNAISEKVAVEPHWLPMLSIFGACTMIVWGLVFVFKSKQLSRCKNTTSSLCILFDWWIFNVFIVFLRTKLKLVSIDWTIHLLSESLHLFIAQGCLFFFDKHCWYLFFNSNTQ